MLYGSPGTGKTQIARTIANESKLQFIAASTADLKAGYTGQSGQKVRELFERARARSPAIVFIDEIEVAAASRSGGSGSDQFTQEIVAQLLQELDGVKNSSADIFVLAATNHLEQIDSAVLSRLPLKIEITLPDHIARVNIFKTLIGNITVGFDIQTVCNKLASETEGKSGRDIRSMVEDATQKAVIRAIKKGMPDQVLMEQNDFQLLASINY